MIYATTKYLQITIMQQSNNDIFMLCIKNRQFQFFNRYSDLIFNIQRNIHTLEVIADNNENYPQKNAPAMICRQKHINDCDAYCLLKEIYFIIYAKMKYYYLFRFLSI